MTLLWLDDNPEMLSYEQKLISEDINIINFQLIDELLEYLEENILIIEDTLFVIDIVLINENLIFFKDVEFLTEDFNAGIDLYTKVLDIYFPNIPVILYTSRPTDSDYHNIIRVNDRFNKTLFLLNKDKFEDLVNIINKFNN